MPGHPNLLINNFFAKLVKSFLFLYIEFTNEGSIEMMTDLWREAF